MRDKDVRIQELLEANNRYQQMYRDARQPPKLKFIRQKMILRQDLQANLDKIYIFGDNGERQGMAGQAAAMRHEPNAHGIATKPMLSDVMDDKKPSHWNLVLGDIHELEIRIWRERPIAIIIPEDGIGTGLAQMDKVAPRMFERMNSELALLEEKYGY